MNSFKVLLCGLLLLLASAEGILMVVRGDSWGAEKTERPLLSTIHKTRKTLKKFRKWKTKHKAEMGLVKCLSDHWNIDIPGLRSSNYVIYEYVITDDVTLNPLDAVRRKRRNTKSGEERNSAEVTDSATTHPLNAPRRKGRYINLREVPDGQNSSTETIDRDKAEAVGGAEEGGKRGGGKRHKLANLSKSDSAKTPETAKPPPIDSTVLLRVGRALASLWNFVKEHIYEAYFARFWKNKLLVCTREYGAAKFWAWVDSAPD